MKANELRIGNVIDVFGMCKVDRIYQNSIKVIRETDTGFEREDVPIDSLSLTEFVLTDEWLENLGFKKHPKFMGMHKDNFIVNNNVLLYKGCDIGITVKHVHELQNLYFALTGEELEIKN